jgi:hypothetical protein
VNSLPITHKCEGQEAEGEEKIMMMKKKGLREGGVRL